MKKLIFICVVMALVLGGGVAETVLSARLFRGMNTELVALNESIIAHADEVDSPEIVERAEKILARWESKKDLVLLFNNHNIVRSLDDKLVSLSAYLGCGAYEDSRMYCESAIMLTADLIDETYPLFGNLF